ncbi:MAG: hypothetical protein WBC15_13875 [Mycobacterium sp.]
MEQPAVTDRGTEFERRADDFGSFHARRIPLGMKIKPDSRKIGRLGWSCSICRYDSLVPPSARSTAS